jgi:hypothetical protein
MMPNLDENAFNRLAARSFSVTAGLLTREFVMAWFIAIAAVAILPAIFVFGIVTDIVRRMAPRKKVGAIVIEGKYRVLS